MAEAVSIFAAPERHAGWRWPVFAGIASILFGVIALAQPVLASLAATLYFGFTLLSAGVVGIVTGLFVMRHRVGWLLVLVGLLSLLIGLSLLLDLMSGAVSLVWAVGLWLFVGGLFELGMAFGRMDHRGSLILVAMVDLVLGSAILAFDPADALSFLGVLVGVSFIVRGAWSIAFGRGLRRAARG